MRITARSKAHDDFLIIDHAENESHSAFSYSKKLFETGEFFDIECFECGMREDFLDDIEPDRTIPCGESKDSFEKGIHGYRGDFFCDFFGRDCLRVSANSVIGRPFGKDQPPPCFVEKETTASPSLYLSIDTSALSS